nr:uncharacterized protein LOC128703115 [Cherax quadricarinatus]
MKKMKELNDKSIVKTCDKSENGNKSWNSCIFVEQNKIPIINEMEKSSSTTSERKKSFSKILVKRQHSLKTKSTFICKLIPGERMSGNNPQSQILPETGSWGNPKLCIKRVVSSLRIILDILSIGILSFWQRINTNLKFITSGISQIGKAFISLLIEVSPRKLVKHFLTFFCYIIPSLKYRSLPLVLCNLTSPRRIKKLVSLYLRHAPVRMIAWHSNLCLRANSPGKKLIRNMSQLLRFPTLLLETIFMAAVCILNALSRSLDFFSGNATKEVRKRPSFSSWRQMMKQNSVNNGQNECQEAR